MKQLLSSGTDLHPQLFRRNSIFHEKVDPVALGQECSSVVEHVQLLRAEDLRTRNLLDRISFTLNELEGLGSWSSCWARRRRIVPLVPSHHRRRREDEESPALV